MAANVISSFVLGEQLWYTRWHLHDSEQGNIKKDCLQMDLFS